MRIGFIEKWLGYFALRTQFAVAFGCLALIAITSTITSISMLDGIKNNHLDTSKEWISKDDALNIGILALECRRWEKDLFLNINNQTKYERYLQNWETAITQLRTAIDQADLNYSYRNDQSDTQAMQSGRENLLSGGSHQIDQYEDGMRALIHQIKNGVITNAEDANQTFAQYKWSIRNLVKIAEAQSYVYDAKADQAEHQLSSNLFHADFILRTMAVISIILSAVLTLLFAGILSKRARILCADLDAVKHGDFSAEIQLEGQDEFATVAGAINSLLTHINKQTMELKNDIKIQKSTEADLLEAKQRFELAVRGSRDGLWDWNLITDQIYYAPRWKQMLGLRDDEIGSSPDEWTSRIISKDLDVFKERIAAHIDSDEDEFEIESRMVHTDGSIRWMLCRGAAIRDDSGKAFRLAGSFAEITDIKEAQEQLRITAEHDRLTGLPNRELLKDRVQQAILSTHRDSDTIFAVLFFDFDRFKIVNDSLGHDAGDELLINISNRFRKEIRAFDTAARFGGDEFVVLLQKLNCPEEAIEITNRLLEAFAVPHQIQGHEITSTASIGLVTSNMGFENADEIIRDADAAMYQAKNAGRGRVVVFDKTMHEEAVDRLQLEKDMRMSIEQEQFHLRYQPILDLESGDIYGFEALIRWDHPVRGLVPPDHFIYIAEDSGLIIPIGEWVFREACRQAKIWNDLYGQNRPICITVNMSKRQICHPNIVDTIQTIIKETGAKHSYIRIEITETTIVDARHDMVPVLEEIRALGIALAMDDFGTGQSSLATLHKFPIDILKIDRGFIQSMEINRELSAVIQSIISLAHHLNMTIVAEGIETLDQIAVLQALGCELGQGYQFAKPLIVPDAEKFIIGLTGAAKSA